MRPFLNFGVLFCFGCQLLNIVVAEPVEDFAFLFVGDTNTSAYLGASQGLIEANAQGEFLDTSYELRTSSASETPNFEGIAIVAAVGAQQLIALAQGFPDIAILNVVQAESTQGEQCVNNVFHVAPSAAMIADANSQWQKVNPGSKARAHAWHASFEKYAAGQLNIRFRKQFDRDMDDAAWAGWAAVKLLSDTIVRQPTLSSRQLINELKTNLAFDGQKGLDLSFRETGQLRQPLLLVDGDQVVGEAPVRGAADSSNLDSLGIVFCPK
ncbi:MAG: hypothetical protein O3C28_04775 [Proteobacteria bacterium]|nr:hypothetical protein [Pseudomonadota bacterium]